MASTYSGNLAIELIGTGDQAGTWGATTNTNLGTALEQAITASSDVAFTSGGNSAIALTQSNAFQASRSARLNLTGTMTQPQYLYLPAINKFYVVNNSLSNTVIISNGANGAATGAIVSIPAGTSTLVYNDGTNIVSPISSLPSLSNVTISNVTINSGNANFTNVTVGNVTINGGTANLTNLTLQTALSLSSGGTGANTAPGAMTNLMGFTSTSTAGATTALSNTSSYYQIFTGTLNQNVTLPVASTINTGWTFHICNNSAGNLTINSSGGNTVISVVSGLTAMCTCISTSGTSETSWEAGFTDFATATGSGSVVLSSNATVVNPQINAYTEGITTGYVNTGSAFTLNIASSTIITANLSASCTFTMPSNAAGKSFILFLKTGAGTFTGTFTGVKFVGNTAPTITAVANRMDILTFAADGANWYGNYAQNYNPN